MARYTVFHRELWLSEDGEDGWKSSLGSELYTLDEMGSR